MPRRPTREVPVVLLHGWYGSGPEHWQTWLAEQLRAAGREVRYPVLPDPETPTLLAWHAALLDALDGLPDDGFDLLAHSLGAVLWLHHVSSPTGREAPRPGRVALVAPPSPTLDAPALATFLPPPLDIDAVRAGADGTVLVCGPGDPYCPEGAETAYGRPLKLATTVVPDGGHLNVASGFGPWPAVLDWCNRDGLAFY